ncbi:MAG: nucleoside 2-deoxyribosyltransferase [Methanosarcinales archaeon]|nr:nucleoside 2-deoxyribosyltransferase [Methanosarcinales archaeon]
MKSIYLAAPLFSVAEQEFNLRLAAAFKEKGFAVFLPQEDSKDTKDMRGQDLQDYIFNSNAKAIRDCDIMVAVLDGADVDSGTAWEVGYAHALEKTVIGLRTDFRTLGEHEGVVNIMIAYSMETIYQNIEKLMDALADIYN